MTRFTGEKFVSGQERFAPWCSAPQADRDAPGDEFIPAFGGRGRSTRLDVGLGVPLVGLGAPASTYYPAIGALLGAETHVPADADVANAIGAVVGTVRVRHEVLVTAPRRGVYRIHVGGEPETEWERADARARAEEAAVTGAKKAAVSAGTTDFTVELDWTEKVIDVGGRPMFVEGRAAATASGRPHLH